MSEKEASMNIECPHCNMVYNLADIEHTLKNGSFKCPVCEKKIPSPLADHKEFIQPTTTSKYLSPVLIILVIAITLVAIRFFAVTDKKPPATTTTAPFIMPASPNSPPSQSVEVPAMQTVIAPPRIPNKMEIVERIAADFHKSHSYTLEGDFVCLDMAIDVWNQLVTNGIEAKIMGGNVRENITSWNYRQLVMGSNHAWVVAKVSPTEKVAIETTAGVVIKTGMKNAAAYFKGIEFDNPAQIKKFDLLRKKAHEICRDAHQLINDWNENVAGKQRASGETIAMQARIEQKKMDCESTINNLQEFKSRAIYY